ncbi:PREDICTED: epoxide hydrolase 1-like [Papilio polytes]|uniref:epoxide hydrolase 1-like n=1 Tax=Papilio polytes TaxID=76194 RepID=UPI000675C742|nr:PREDICTED: epoxide hydrolase 1-like [Papilio polytes]
MSCIVIFRFIATILLVFIYSFIFLFVVLFGTLKYHLKYLCRQKPKIVKPASLTDPKYGEHKYIKANNVKLHYVESGDPSKPLMLFIHGFPEFWYTWRHQIVEFNKEYRVVAINLRGYAGSDKPKGISSYKLDVLVEDVRDFIRNLGSSKCIIVSHDWGGIVASRFRDTYPECVSGLVMFASMCKESWQRDIWNNCKQHFGAWYTFFFLVPKLPEWWFEMGNLEVYEWIFKQEGKNVDEDTINCYKYTFSKPGSFTPPINYYRSVFSLTTKRNNIDNNVPMLVANAAKDSSLLPNLLNRMKEDYKYIETKLLEDCYHFFQEHEPELINKLIREFLVKHKL